MINRKIGLVLSGGGTRGFTHLGVLKALEEHNIVPTMVSGSSVGALVGSLYCAGLSSDEIMIYLKKHQLNKQLKWAFDRKGLFSMQKLEKLLIEIFPENTFEALKIPLVVCTTNIKKGDITYFSAGELAKPVTASCAIPGLFTPVKINGKSYLDGGLLNNLPIEPLQNHCDYFIGVNLMPPEKNMPVQSAKEILLKCLMMSVGIQTNLKLNQFDLIIQPDGISHYNGLKLKKTQELYDLGYQTAITCLKNLKID